MRAPLFSQGFRVVFFTGMLLGALALRLLAAGVLPVSVAAQTAAPAEAAHAVWRRAPVPGAELDAPRSGTALSEAPQPDFSPAEAESITLCGNSSYAPDLTSLLLAPLPFTVGSAPQVLIFHTHTTEAYTPAGDGYAEIGAYHTLDETQSVLAVGDALAAALTERGLGVLHDRTVHDWPDYNSSYSNAKLTLEAALAEHPSVVLALDLHRDAVDPPQREIATPEGVDCARLMLVVGTDEGGLYHPFWQENLSVALKLQALLNREAPELCRPLNLRRERFNGQASPGAFIVEVGSTGNTLEEAKRSMPYLADAIAELLAGGR